MPHIEEDQPPKAICQQALKSFRILGTESLDEVVKRLDQAVAKAAAETILEMIRDECYTNGGLAGRMLLRAWGQRNPDLGREFEEWLHYDPIPQIGESTKESSACALWPTTSLPLSPEHLNLLKNLPCPDPKSYYTPFGPEKAEDDPRLPDQTIPPSEKDSLSERNSAIKRKTTGLFYRGVEWYAEITAERHGFFFAPHGCGRTAAIWNARHTHRISGYRSALSLYLLLSPPFEMEHLLYRVANALGRALCCALIEDAYWFMASDRRIQASIGHFLLWWAGDLATLMRYFRSGGLQVAINPIKNAKNEEKLNSFYDGQLLTDILAQYTSLDSINWEVLVSVTHDARIAIGNVYRSIQNDWNYPVYLWVDSNLPTDAAIQELLALWNNEFLRRMGNLKIFTQDEFPNHSQTRMEWSPGNLNAMYNYRRDKVNAQSFLNQQHLGGSSYELLEKFEAEIDQLHCPQEMIRKGNRLLETMGEPLLTGR